MEPIIRFRPLHDHVVVLRENPEKKIGSIIIPDTNEKRAPIGIVLAVGPGRILEDGTREEMSVKVGQKIAFAPHIPMVLEAFSTKDQRIELLRDRDCNAVFDSARMVRVVRMACPDQEHPPVYTSDLKSAVCHERRFDAASSELVITYSYDIEEDDLLARAFQSVAQSSVVEDRSDAC